MTDARAALAQVREALAAMRGDWLGDGFTKLHRSQIVAVLDGQAAEIERLRSERDSIAIENSKFMDQIERLRDELRRQLAEAELDARRYRWIAGHCRSTSEHWGGRWSIVVEGPCPAKHDEEGAFDAAIDAAMDLTRPAEES